MTCLQWLWCIHNFLHQGSLASYIKYIIYLRGVPFSRWRVCLRCGWSWEVVGFAHLACQPVGRLCSFALGKNTHLYHFASPCGSAAQLICVTWSKFSEEAHLYLQIRLSSDLVLELAVCPLQDIYSRLTDVDPQGWRILKDKTTGIICFFLPKLGCGSWFNYVDW